MRIFLLSGDYNGDRIYTLKAKEKQYLSKVLRLERGTVFTAKDRKENYYKAELIDDDTLTLDSTENPEETLLDGLSGYKGEFFPITMFISILKGKKNELVVKALTEMGVKKIVFVKTEFVQEKDFTVHQRERLESIVREAVQQSGAKSPILEGPIDFDKAIEEAPKNSMILHQSTRGRTLSLTSAVNNMDGEKEYGCFIGPEGGFSNSECEKAENRGFATVLLNTNILRAETAAIYTAASLQTLLQG